ncbi:MAG: hypothetical protein LPK11_05680 [Chromatiaceae bacterium]|nr:hypothetical protein [Chromatiaceae bacterium]
MKGIFNYPIFIATFLFILAGCGGGSENDAGNQSGSGGSGGSGTPLPQVNDGGQPSSPANISFSLPNVISSDSFNNYFKVTVNAGDRLVLNVDLESALTAEDTRRCFNSPETYVHGSIESVIHFCAYDLVHSFATAGTYTVRFQYPRQQKGLFYAALLRSGTSYNALAANGSGGTPNQPRLMSFTSDNKINKLSIFNNYQFTGLAGDKLVFHTILNAPLASNAIRRCESGNYDSHHSLGVSVNYGNYSCSETTEYVLPNDGTYNFNLRFVSVDNYGKIDGAFRVDLIR